MRSEAWAEGLATANENTGFTRTVARTARKIFPAVEKASDELGLASVAGFFASGEIGPLAGRNQVQGFTATVLAFGT